MVNKKRVSKVLVFVLLVSTLLSSAVFAADWEAANDIAIKAKAHIQTHGDKEYEGKGEITLGTTGEAKRIEKISLDLVGAPRDMFIEYKAHVQSIGDVDWTTGPRSVGTEGKAKRIEQIAIKLVDKAGNPYPGYTVKYQVHMQSYGWGASKDLSAKNGKADSWVADGEWAGTRGEAKRLEAIRIKIEKEKKLAVEDVEALNLKQIKVTFNKPVDAKKENFVVNGNKLEVGEFQLSEDKTAATLFVADDLKIGQKVKVVIDGILGLATETYEVTLNDIDIPYVEKVEAVGNKLINVYFSEPIKKAGLITDYRINGSVRNGMVTIPAGRMNKVVQVKLTNALADGSYNLVVNGANVTDYAGRSLGVNNTPFVIAKDTALPVATVIEATQQRVVVQFDREVRAHGSEGADMRIRRTVNGTNYDSNVGQSLDNKTWTFIFSDANRLPAGENKVSIIKVVDYSGNKGAVELNFIANIDLERPEVVSVKQVDNAVFEVEFSKPVNKDSGSFVFRPSVGALPTVTKTYKANSANKVVVLNVSTVRADRNPYTLEIKGVHDGTYLKNAVVDYIQTDIMVKDASELTVTNLIRSGRVVSVTFSKPIDTASVSTANFRYSVSGSSFYSLPSAAYIEIVNTNTINIVFPTKFGPTDNHNVELMNSLYVSNVKDLYGTTMLAQTKLFDANSGTEVKAVGNKAYALDTKTIVFEVDESICGKLANIWMGDFVVKAGTKELTVTDAKLVTADEDYNKYAALPGRTASLANESQVVVLTLSDALDEAAQVDGKPVTVSTRSVVDFTKTALEMPLKLTDITVNDYIVPSGLAVANFKYDNATNILSVANPFITSENVKIEYAIADADADAITKTGDLVETVKRVFDGTEKTSALTVSDGKAVYVRLVDSKDNYTDWAKVGTQKPIAPTAKFDFADEKLVITSDGGSSYVYEYSLDEGSTWKKVTNPADTVLTINDAIKSIKVRVKEGTSYAAGEVTTITLLDAPTGITFVQGDADGSTVAISTKATMQYSTDGSTWKDCGDTKTTITGVNADTVVKIRVKSADDGSTAGRIFTHTLLAEEIKIGA